MQYYYEQKPSGLDLFAPPITRMLIFLNVVVWILQQLLPSRLGIDLTDILGLHYFEADKFQLYQLVSYMFLHSTSSVGHLISNMFSLWVTGSVIERYWGERRYLLYYFVTGICAGLVQEAVWYYDFHEVTRYTQQIVEVPGLGAILGRELLNLPITVGASGAIFGLLLAVGVVFPNAPMYLIFFPVPIKTKYYVLLLGLYELFQGVHATGSSIAHFAHLGGMLGGGLLIYLWRKHHHKPFV